MNQQTAAFLNEHHLDEAKKDFETPAGVC